MGNLSAEPAEAKRKESLRHIDAVQKALIILNCFTDSSKLRLTDICSMTGLTKNRVVRICGTLEAMHFLSYDPAMKYYSLGPSVLVLGKAYEKSNDLFSVIKPMVWRLREQTEQTASFIIPDGKYRTCIIKEEGPNSVRYSIAEGQRMDLFSGSSGMVFLSCLFSSEPVPFAYGQEEYEEIKRSKKVNSEFKAKLEQIRDDGFSLRLGSSKDGAGLSVPAFNYNGQLVGCLCLSGPVDQFNEGQYEKFLPVVLSCAGEISRQFGYVK